MVDRAFAYDFCDKGSPQPIWRICNHSNSMKSVNDPCHVHVGHDDNEIALANTSHDIDFTYAMRCIKKFYLQKPQDWEEGGCDES